MSPLFVGRRAEVAAVRADAASAGQGRGRVVVIEGEAGIGKTRLLEESLDGGGGLVCRGVAEELTGDLPFGVVVDALGIDLRAAPIGRLLLTATGKTAGSEGLGLRVSEALLAHVDYLCADGPVTLVLEDIHWADASSLALLERLASRARDLPLLVVATRRPSPERPTLDRLIGRLTDGSARRLVLGPLGDDDTQALARTMLGGEPGPRLLSHLAGAAGNPLFVTELIDAVRRSGDLTRRADGTFDLAGGLLPTSFAVLVLHRLSFLPLETLEALRMAALFGTSFPVTDLCLVLPLSYTAIASTLRPALVAGMLEDVGTRFRFRHDLIREALYLDIPEPLRHHLHLEVARALAATDAPAERVAEHLLRGASPESPLAGPALRAIAARLAVRAPGLAADVLARAVELAGRQGEREELLVERAEALWVSGRLLEAEALCRAVLLGQTHPEARLCLAQVLIAQGRAGEAAATIDEGLAAGQSGRVQARLLAWAGWACVCAGELDAGEERAAAAHRAAMAIGDRFGQIVALATRAAVAHLRGHFPDAIKLAREGLRLDREPGRGAEHFPLHLLLASFFFDAGRLDEGHAALGRATADSDERGSRWELPGCHRLAARGLFLAGRWDDALAELDAAATVADELGSRPSTEYGQALAALISLHRGDIPGARRALAATEDERQFVSAPNRFDWLLWARALVSEASGDPVEGFRLIEHAWHLCAEAGIALGSSLIAPDVVRLALGAGDEVRAKEAVEAVEAAAARAGTTTVIEATAGRCRGLLGGDPVALVEAAGGYRAVGRPLEAAQTSEEAAAVLAQLGRAEEARALLDEALQQYAGLRATYDSARVEARLRDLGVRRGRGGPRRRPRHGWASLTETERVVAALVAEGLSNRQIAARLFLSGHTVHTHVSHILAKLGFTSRVELAMEALRHSR